MAKLLFMAGSAAQSSLNKILAQYAAQIAKEKGADVEFIDLKDYEMPLFCMDYQNEHGIPQTTLDLKAKFQQCDGFFVASPEYNSAYTPLLKNTIDWMSRPSEEGEPMLSAYQGKVAAIASVSPGALGGLRGLTPLRVLLSNIGVHVIPSQIAIGGADHFDDQGQLVNDRYKSMMNDQIDQFIKTAQALSA